MALDREILKVAVPAEYLERRIGRARRGLGRVELRLGRRLGEPQPRVRKGRGAVHKQTGRVELGPGTREAPLDHLEVGDRSSELPALLRISDRDLEGRAAETDRESSDRSEERRVGKE